MFRPEDISNEQFELSVLGGYKREQVDSFFATVASDYEKLYKENAELISKLKVCVEKIDEYQKDEQFLKAAIINAEKLNETSLRELERREKEIETTAREKAEGIVAKAKLEADELLSSAKAESEQLLSNARIDSENIIKKAQADSAEAIRACEAETAAKISELKAAQSTEQINLNNLKKEVADFKDNVLKLYKQHLNSLSKLPEYEEKAKETVQVEKTPDVDPVTPAVQSEEREMNSEDDTVKETTQQSPEGSLNAKTAEFVIEKSAPVPKIDERELDRNFKFKDLKFGTDFDIKKQK